MSRDPQSMTFWEHLGELRSRILRVLVAFVLCSGFAWFYREQLMLWLTAPYVTAWTEQGVDGNVALHFQAPAALFLGYVKITLLAGAVLSLPVALYQLWAFIAPGLYKREQRLAIPFVTASCALFASGAYFGFRVVFPMAFRYLLGFSGAIGGSAFEVKPTVMVDQYLEFVTRMLLAFGLVFELPVLTFFLSVAGIVNHRHLIRFARYFVVIAFILGAVFTPPDPASQLFLAIPLCLLYGLSIGIAYLFGKKQRSDGELASS